MIPAPDRAASRPTRRDLALVPLRLFLGVTFCYAGLQKLANRHYLDAHATSGVANQMKLMVHTSPIGGVLRGASHHAVLFGLLIAFGELAVGIGTLLGLWTRVAAIGGVLLSLSFLLTVSWGTDPYYLGPDIVFLFAFLPLAIDVPSPWSVDAAVARRLHLPLASPIRAVSFEDRRRRLAETGAVALWVGVIGLVGSGAAAGLGRLLSDGDKSNTAGGGGGVVLKAPANPPAATTGSTSSTVSSSTSVATTGSDPTSSSATSTTPPTTTAPPPTTTIPGTPIGLATDVPVGGSASFTDPATGERAIVVQPRAGVFEACSAVCTHQGCTVAYQPGSGLLHCPCHGAEFDPSTGAVQRGPAQQSLATITIRTASNGYLYVGS